MAEERFWGMFKGLIIKIMFFSPSLSVFRFYAFVLFLFLFKKFDHHIQLSK